MQERLAGLSTMQPPSGGQLPVDFIDVIHMYEKIARSWADVADLVKPIYDDKA